MSATGQTSLVRSPKNGGSAGSGTGSDATTAWPIQLLRRPRLSIGRDEDTMEGRLQEIRSPVDASMLGVIHSDSIYTGSRLKNLATGTKRRRKRDNHKIRGEPIGPSCKGPCEARSLRIGPPQNWPPQRVAVTAIASSGPRAWCAWTRWRRAPKRQHAAEDTLRRPPSQR